MTLRKKVTLSNDAITLFHKKAVGDTVVLSALVRDLKLAYPHLRISVSTNWRELWLGNPYVENVSVNPDPASRVVSLTYRNDITQSNARGQHIHFLQAFHRDLQKRTGMVAQPTEPRPDLHLLPEEKGLRPIAERYWVVMAGSKLDATVKQWQADRYQQLFDRLRERGINCVQLGAGRHDCVNYSYQNVLSLVGRTEMRQFLQLVYHADGVICPITSAMHIAAALEKPCVVIAGGREAWWWEAYTPENDGLPNSERLRVPHVFLHTQGLLPCCLKAGCWKNRTVAIDQQDYTAKGLKRLCKDVVRVPDVGPTPRCMNLITVDHVLEAVMSYYQKGFLPHISEKLIQPSGDPEVAIHEPAAPTPAPLQILPGPTYAQPAAPPKVPRMEGPPVPKELNPLDNPILGGRITLCMLAYGDYPDLAKRCLSSIYDSVSPDLIDLRLGANACSDRTLQVLQSFPAKRLYVSEENIFKYPLMRKMFYDPDCPITTSYLVWFDDDSYVNSRYWLANLARCITENHGPGARLFGIKFYHDLKQHYRNGNDPRRWFNSATWWRGRQLQTPQGKETPNGTALHFVSGGFWALHVPTMRQADIPDVRLLNNGGDITIGEQVHQAGFKNKDFNRNKVFVFSSGAARRGVTHKFPWSWEASTMAETVGAG